MSTGCTVIDLSDLIKLDKTHISSDKNKILNNYDVFLNSCV